MPSSSPHTLVKPPLLPKAAQHQAAREVAQPLDGDVVDDEIARICREINQPGTVRRQVATKGDPKLEARIAPALSSAPTASMPSSAPSGKGLALVDRALYTRSPIVPNSVESQEVVQVNLPPPTESIPKSNKGQATKATPQANKDQAIKTPSQATKRETSKTPLRGRKVAEVPQRSIQSRAPSLSPQDVKRQGTEITSQNTAEPTKEALSQGSERKTFKKKRRSPKNPSDMKTNSDIIHVSGLDSCTLPEVPLVDDAQGLHNVKLPSPITRSADTTPAVQSKSSSDVCWLFLKGRCPYNPCERLHVSAPPHVCKDWLFGLCERNPCPRKHEMPDKNVKYPHVCNLWLRRGVCDRQVCYFQHELPAKEQKLPSPDSSIAVKPDPLQVTLFDHTKVKLDSGFEVISIATGFENRWVHVAGIPPDVSCKAIEKLLKSFGQVDQLLGLDPTVTLSKSRYIKVQYSAALEASDAAQKLNGHSLSGAKLIAKIPVNNTTRGNGVLDDTTVHLEWKAPGRMAYVGYSTLKEAIDAVEAADGKVFRNHIISATLYDGLPSVGAFNVLFEGLPHDTKEAELRVYGTAEAMMLERPNYQSLQQAINNIKKMLEDCGELLSFDVIPPPYREGTVKATARFISSREATYAQEHIHERKPQFLGRTLLVARHVQSLEYHVARRTFTQIAGDLSHLRWSWNTGRKQGVTVYNAGEQWSGPVKVKLCAENAKELSVLKVKYERIQKGETVVDDKVPVWDDHFSRPAGVEFIRMLDNEYPLARIIVDRSRRIISVWGPIVSRTVICRRIVGKYRYIQSRRRWEIPLSGRLTSMIASNRVYKLQDDLARDRCRLDAPNRRLVVFGEQILYTATCRLIEKLQASPEQNSSKSATSTCPVCFGDPTDPTSLSCGHVWCRSCLSDYILSSVDSKSFPLSCLGNDATCAECIPLSIAQSLLSAAEFESIAQASFSAFVHARPDEFFYCPTPDCTQVYRASAHDAILQCPSCLARICSACHVEAHDGMTCAERDASEEKLFTEWTDQHDVKRCPSCKVAIERSEGCNHMTCTRCQTHICWVCLATFHKGKGIYDHMRQEHGGIGL
ncbi:hypothetical protein CONPUDRAFT_84352 [Coniophora puteana RWD-64-598 SS2]|uniref:RING-type E3 ubiquitin transferase n=1 Tax=Coniophora puteana (strain RWD-64-598) TaxID=741705 RepID=A0A5M3MDT8_CONPW|nr:uncharacterized protein CONPUDRAFT_84352 [Coniophora puteana RWD-64-598 SS2]EIW77156.1 hypothetical protein CONPUDRAFT_84352 [Coniophora puteana RWD-64-598 SS2]